MTRLVRFTVAGDTAEAEEIQGILSSVGIESELQTLADADPLTVLVPESSLEDAKDAIEALTEDDELISEP